MRIKTDATTPSGREAFFLSFSQRARALLDSLDATALPSAPPAILITGGLRSRRGMHAALSGACDLVGLGRPAAVDPHLPLKLLDPAIADEDARAPQYDVGGGGLLALLPGSELWLPGVVTLWHTMALREVANGSDVRLHASVEAKVWSVVVVPALLRLGSKYGGWAVALVVLLMAWRSI